MDKYEEVAEIGTGAYGTVYRARDLQNEGKLVALKRVRVKNNEDGMPISTIREIALLKRLDTFANPNIVKLLDMFHTPLSLSDPSSREIWLNLVFEHVDQDLATYIEKCPPEDLNPAKIKDLTQQLLKAVDFLHAHQVVHRDLKPQNILVTKDGMIKVADFGLARMYRSSMALTSVVVTLWYRSPEVLLQSTYATPVDLWSVGCVLAELYNRFPLFEGKSDVDQLHKIFSVIGSPREDEWPANTCLPWCSFAHYTARPLCQVVPGMCPLALDLLRKMLVFCPYSRISAKDALNHSFFNKMDEAPAWKMSKQEVDMRADKLEVSAALKRPLSPDSSPEELHVKQVCVRQDRGFLSLPLASNYSPPKTENISQRLQVTQNETFHNFSLHSEQWHNERSELENHLLQQSVSTGNSLSSSGSADKENVLNDTAKLGKWFTPVAEDGFLQSQRNVNPASNLQRTQPVNPTYVVASVSVQRQNVEDTDENNNYVPARYVPRTEDLGHLDNPGVAEIGLESTSAFEVKGHSFMPKSSPITN